MNNKLKSRKDLIKNIAIVFLAVMLVLTFFSNTIMNWSLPEVSGKYTEYGEIKTGVRGSGAVVSNMTYSEVVNGSRKVEEVFVYRGSQVEAGQTLMILGPANGDKIEALTAEVKTLSEAYDKAILNKTVYDYTSDELSINNAIEDLNELKAERARYGESFLEDAEKKLAEAETALESASDLVASLEEQIEAMTENSDDPAIVAARAERDKALERRDIAKEAYDKADKAFSTAQKVDTSSLESMLNGYYDALDDAKTALSHSREDNEDLLKIKTDMNLSKDAYDKAVADFGEGSAEANAAKTLYDSALALYETNKDDIKTAERDIKAKEDAVKDVEYNIYSVRSDITAANTSNREYNNLKATLEIKAKALETEEAELEAKENALKAIIESSNKELSASLKEAKKAVALATEEKQKAEAALSKANEIKSLDAQIKSSERSLVQMQMAFEDKKESDKKQQLLSDYDLNLQYEELQEKKKELEALSGGKASSFELRATHAGTVSEVTFRAGEITTDGATAVVIDVVESGYTVSFSVTNAEATRLKVGDTGTVSDTYWGQNVSATLSKIIPDPTGKTKTLVFDLVGDVNAGQSLTITVGERSTGYSSVIPKSALHEDANGKFIYITKTKSTPLGDRFVATRLDVSVAASDDKNVAITTDDAYLYEYLITSSTKPFEEGDYVRLSD